MFKLVSLKAAGFKRLDLVKPLVFPDGLFLIHGRNESGKSTIMEAIHYALYGLALKPKKRAANEDLINYSLPEGFVELEFVVDENLYRVRRVLRRKGANHHELVITKKDGRKERIRGYHDVNVRREEDLHGIDSDALLNSCMVEQKELGKLEAAQRADRIRAVTTLLNIEAFVDASGELKSDHRVLDRQNLQVEKELEEQRRRKDAHEEALKRKEKAEKRLEEISRELPEMEDEVKRLSEVVRLHRELKEKQKELELFGGRVKDAEKALQEARDKRKEAQRLGREIETWKGAEVAEGAFEKVEEVASSLVESLGEKERLRKRVEELRERLDSLKGLEERIEGLREQRRALEIERRRVSNRRMTGAGSVGLGVVVAAASWFVFLPLVALGIAFMVLGGYLVSKNVPARVDARARLVQGDLEAALGEGAGVDQLRQELVKTDERLEEVGDAATEVGEKLVAAVEELPNSPREYGKVYESVAEAGASEAVKVLRAKIQEDVRRLAGLRSSREEVKKEAEKAAEREEKLGNLEDKQEVLKEEVEGSERALDEEADKAKILLEEVGEKGKELDALTKRLGGLEQEKAEREREVKEAAGVADETKDAPERYEKLEDAYDGNRFELEALTRAVRLLDSTRDQIVAGVKDRIESHMMKFLPTLTAGRYNLARIDETDYRIEIYDREAKDWRSKGVFSGATQDQFSLALRLAFALSTLPSTRGARPAFIFLDEPLSGFDAERRRGFLDLLSQELARSFEQVIVVSHLAQLRQEIPNSILLENGQVAGGTV